MRNWDRDILSSVFRESLPFFQYNIRSSSVYASGGGQEGEVRTSVTNQIRTDLGVDVNKTRDREDLTRLDCCYKAPLAVPKDRNVHYTL